MPRGTRHVVTGTLRRSTLGPVVEMDDGGRWQVDIDGRWRRHLGRRVRIEGVRTGFDLLAVERMIVEDDGGRSPAPPVRGWRQWFGTILRRP